MTWKRFGQVLLAAALCAACAFAGTRLMHRLFPVPEAAVPGAIEGVPMGPDEDPDPDAGPVPEDRPDYFYFDDMKIAIIPDLPANPHAEEAFSADPDGRVLLDGARTGIDASAYQGDVDWKAVAGDGVSFAIIRCGLRGYGSGDIAPDGMFEANMAGASAAGLDVGVYFFSQALSPEEAMEEAGFVLDVLGGRSTDLPIWFDWERQDADGSRTRDAGGDVMTACAVAFCDRIRAGGYEAGVYFNARQGYLEYDLEALRDYAFWFAGYGHDYMGFRYAADIWQYSCTGRVAGISGDVDLDLMLPSE